jgi:hypothetical protein
MRTVYFGEHFVQKLTIHLPLPHYLLFHPPPPSPPSPKDISVRIVMKVRFHHSCQCVLDFGSEHSSKFTGFCDQSLSRIKIYSSTVSLVQLIIHRIVYSPVYTVYA